MDTRCGTDCEHTAGGGETLERSWRGAATALLLCEAKGHTNKPQPPHDYATGGALERCGVKTNTEP